MTRSPRILELASDIESIEMFVRTRKSVSSPDRNYLLLTDMSTTNNDQASPLTGKKM